MSIQYTIQFDPEGELKGPLGKLSEFRILDLNFDIVGGVVQEITFNLDVVEKLAALQTRLMTGSKLDSGAVIVRGYDGSGPGVGIDGEPDGEILFQLSLGDAFLTQFATGFSQSSGLTHTVGLQTRNIDLLTVNGLDATGEIDTDQRVQLTGNDAAEYVLTEIGGLTSSATSSLPEASEDTSGFDGSLRHWFTFTTGTLESGYRTHWLEAEAFDFQFSAKAFFGDSAGGSRDSLGRPEIGQLSLLREADDASLMFQHLMETGAETGKLTLVTLAPTGERGEWETIRTYDFVNAPRPNAPQDAVAGVALRADTDTGRMMEELTLNVTAYALEGFKKDKYGKIISAGETSFDFGLNKPEPEDVDFLKALGALRFDPDTGTANGESVADPDDIPAPVPLIYRLTIGDKKYDIEAFDFDQEARSLTFELSKQGARGTSEVDNNLTNLATLLGNSAFRNAQLDILKGGEAALS